MFCRFLLRTSPLKIPRLFQQKPFRMHKVAIGPTKILELACNDGTQLNHFKALGWATYGVDSAINLVPYARDQGHTVWNKMWGASHADKYTGMPAEFDAILGQNVLAHVPNPVDFLAGCVERMNNHTRLYMQTSQCDMFADGQFDTVYHEHISFFSPRSFR
jgi:2-polyprenyl-3-methyl-5-hydroxy-6-metoxy-1,4-benzoquinol methylase